MFAGVAVKEEIVGQPGVNVTVGAVEVSSSGAESHDVNAINQLHLIVYTIKWPG